MASGDSLYQKVRTARNKAVDFAVLTEMNAERKTKAPGNQYRYADSTKTEKQLTPKQRLFIKFVGEGDSQKNAAIRAGVKPTASSSTSSQWCQMPIIAKLIGEERKKYEIASQLTKEKVMGMHLEAYNMAKLMAEPMTMVSAARELGKLCGYYDPVRVQVDVNVSGQVALERMNALSDAELLKLISEGAPKGSIMAQEALNAPG